MSKKIATSQTAHVLGRNTRTSSTKDVGTLISLAETSCYNRKVTSEHRTWTFCENSGNPGTFRSKHSIEVLLAADPRVRPCDRALPYRAREVRNSHRRKKGSNLAAAIKNKSRQAVHFTPLTPWTKTRTRSTRLTNISSFTTTRYTLCTRKARRTTTSSLTKRSMAALSVSKRSQGVHPASHPQKGQSSNQSHKASDRGLVAHVPSKRTSVAALWKKTRSTSHARMIGKVTLLRETLCATEVPLTSPPKEKLKRQIQMFRRLVWSNSHCDPLVR